MYRYIIIFLFVTCGFASKTHDISLENVLQRILKIGPPDSFPGVSKSFIQTPKHMLELYHKYTTSGRASGETVRSITPISDPSRLHVRDMVVFNVSHIGPDEEVRLAQLLLHRRRLARHPHPLHRKLLAPPYRVRVFQVIPPEAGATRGARTLPLASVPVAQVSRGGWHSLDITSALRELLLSTPEGSAEQLTLGIRFEAPKTQVIPPARFLDHRENASAFLVAFSNEMPDNRVEEDEEKKSTEAMEHLRIIAELAESRHGKRHHSHHRVDHETDAKHRHKHSNAIDGAGDIKELIAMKRVKKMKRHRKILDDYTKYEDVDDNNRIKSNLIDELLESGKGRRVIRSVERTKSHKRRSIYDNELPYEKLHLQEATTTTEAATTETVADGEEGQLIPYPPGMEKKKKRRGRRRKKKHHEADKMLEKWETSGRHRAPLERTPHDVPQAGVGGNRTCSRKHLEVNFMDLGWAEWIIAPPSFNAYYCSGSCDAPISKSVNTTNHAIIQSLMHDINKGVPAPCCVPHSMASLSVLYIEADSSITLKNFSHMKIKTCRCQ